MKLADFLEMARSAGRLDVEVLSPRGEVLLQAKAPDAAEVDAAIRSDAESLSAKAMHTYVVTVRGELGALSRHRETVRGGRAEDDDEHKVDPEKVTTPGQVLGHVTRMFSDTLKLCQKQGEIIANFKSEENRQLWAYREKYIESEGELGLARLHMEQSERKNQLIVDRVDKWLDKGEGLVRGLLVGKGKLGPAEGQSAVTKLRASLGPYRSRLREILGVARLEAIAWADSPEALADVLLDQVSTGEMEKLMQVIPGDLQRDIALLCKPRWEERQKQAQDEQQQNADAKEKGKPDGT